MKKLLQYSFDLILFVGGLFLIIKFRRPVGLKNLGIMILGLASLFMVLYRYNKKFK